MMATEPHRAGPLEVAKTVLFGMLGVRRKADHEGLRIHPLQLIVAAVVLVALFIFTLLTVVKLVVG